MARKLTLLEIERHVRAKINSLESRSNRNGQDFYDCLGRIEELEDFMTWFEKRTKK